MTSPSRAGGWPARALAGFAGGGGGGGGRLARTWVPAGARAERRVHPPGASVGGHEAPGRAVAAPWLPPRGGSWYPEWVSRRSAVREGGGRIRERGGALLRGKKVAGSAVASTVTERWGSRQANRLPGSEKGGGDGNGRRGARSFHEDLGQNERDGPSFPHGEGDISGIPPPKARTRQRKPHHHADQVAPGGAHAHRHGGPPQAGAPKRRWTSSQGNGESCNTAVKRTAARQLF